MTKLPDIEALLSNDGWLRRIARSLSADADSAEDLAQDAWVAVLAQPDTAHTTRPWLFGVLRNLRRVERRGRRRREQRDRDAARSEALPSSVEVAAEVELRRTVASELLALEEPLRTTLFLRFFRDLPLKEVARLTGVPLSTAHGRVQRGLTRMRKGLDNAYGGDRHAWGAVLLPLARPSGGAQAARSVPLLGGIVMSTGVKSAAALLVAALVIGVWFQVRMTRTAAPASAAPGKEAADLAGGEQEVMELPESVERREARPEAATMPTAQDRSEAPTVAESLDLRGIVVSESGRPVSGAMVGASTGDFRPVGFAMTDKDGRFSIGGVPAGEPLIVVVDVGAFTLRREFGVDPSGGMTGSCG